MMIEESTEGSIVPTEESIAQIGRTGGSIAKIDRIEETTALDIGKTADPGIGENTHQQKAEGTLVITDEGVAKGPLVMEGPLQASP